MWRETVRPLQLAPTVRRNIAHGNVINVSNRTLCPRAPFAKSEIMARSTEVAPVSVNIMEKEIKNKPQSEKLNTNPNY
jgi:hypothetical protein